MIREVRILIERSNFKVSLQCLLFDDEERILLLKRTNTSYANNMYSLPGGHLEKNETIVDGMIRELEEEVGVLLSYKDLELIKVINRRINNNNYIDFIFKASLKGKAVENREKDLCSRMIFREVDNIPKSSLPVVKKIMENSDFFVFMEE